MSQRILNLNGKPFHNFEIAARMRDLLSQENPAYHYKVELYDPADSSLGFVVERQGQQAKNTEGRPQNLKTNAAMGSKPNGVMGASRMDEVSESTIDQNESTRDEPDDPVETVIVHTYHPALRTYILHIPLIFAGLWVFVFTGEVWVTLLSELGLKSLPDWIQGSALVSGTRMLTGVWLAWLILGIVLNYYGTALVVDERGVTLKKGIITRDETNVRFNEIRTIGLKQGILDRLLGIGMLEFASSGTDDMDIRFFNIPNPQDVKAEIEDIIRQYRH